MDRKEKQLFDLYYKKFTNRTFDEKDLFNFLVLVRESAKGINCIRELGDFIAHREKSKGFVKNYLEETERILNNLGNENIVMKIDNVFSFKEIRSGFNLLFQKNDYSKIPSDIINDLILCIISLLQDVKIVSGKSKKEIGKLSFGISSNEIFLMGNIKIKNNQGKLVEVLFPVLTAKNNYLELGPVDKYNTPRTLHDRVIEVINAEGKMKITIPN